MPEEMGLQFMTLAARKYCIFTKEITATAGKTFKVETSPQGVDVLNEVVPVGKTWNIVVSVVVTETDI